MMPTRPTLIARPVAIAGTRNGVAENTTVLTAVAANTPAGMLGRSVWTSRTGVWSIG